MAAIPIVIATIVALLINYLFAVPILIAGTIANIAVIIMLIILIVKKN